jgi:hypothetical protein
LKVQNLFKNLLALIQIDDNIAAANSRGSEKKSRKEEWPGVGNEKFLMGLKNASEKKRQIIKGEFFICVTTYYYCRCHDFFQHVHNNNNDDDAQSVSKQSA